MARLAHRRQIVVRRRTCALPACSSLPTRFRPVPIRRRDFLGGLAGSGLLAAIPTSLAHAAEPDLTRPHALTGAPIDDTWDMSWAERLRGKSRAVFDSPAPDYGGAIFRAVLWREQHAKVFGTSAADLTPVV